MSPRGGSRKSTRGYGVTPWSRALCDVVEGRDTGPVDSRRIAKARSYFRDRNVRQLVIGSGRVTALVDGSQLEPFEVTLTVRPVHAPTVASLLRSQNAVDDLLALTRGTQPKALGQFVLPTEAADIASSCTCPDETVRCIHVLAVTYEVAAEIDKHATTLLTLMGTDLPELLSAVESLSLSDAPSAGETGEPSAPLSPPAAPPLPPLPNPPRMHPILDLDSKALHAALRASGIPAGDVGEAVDQLAELYDVLLE